MALLKRQEISESKLITLGFRQEAKNKENGERVFVKRERGIAKASVVVDKDGFVVLAEGLPKNDDGQFVFFRRILRVRHGKQVVF